MLALFRQSLKPALQFLPFLLKTSWHWILIFHVICFAFTEFFKTMAFLNERNSELLLICKLGEVSTALLYSLFLTLLIPRRWLEWRSSTAIQSFGGIIKKYTAPLVLEGLRVFGKVILWLCFLILPGFFQYWRLSLVPYIVLLNKDYDEGRLDALAHSHALIKGHDFGFVVVLLFLMILDLSFELMTLIPGFPTAFSLQVIISLLTLPLSLYSYALLVEIYDRLEVKLRG